MFKDLFKVLSKAIIKETKPKYWKIFAHSLLNHKSIFQSHGTIEKRILEYLKKVVKTLDTF